MPYRKEQFVNGGIYHVVVRAIDDNFLFKDIDDYYRGIFAFYEFNTTQPIKIRERRKARDNFKRKLKKYTGPSCDLSFVDKRDRLVDIFCFCEMPNHPHLLLKQLKEGGIIKFMSKANTGLAAYFNKKYKRRGHVFQNRFVAVPIKTNEQLKMVFTYIHINPISLIEPKWKERGIKDINKAIEFIENYKWSSYQDYIGKTNFPSVTERKFMLEVMGGEQGCKDFVESWLKYKGEIQKLVDLSLEE